MAVSGPLRKVLAVEVDCSMRDGRGFAATLYLECGHTLYTESRKGVDETGTAQQPPYYREWGAHIVWNSWNGGRKRCAQCETQHQIHKGG